MDLLSVIRRWHYRDRLAIREIERRTHLSWNTIRKYLRSETREPVFANAVRMSNLDPFEPRRDWRRPGGLSSYTASGMASSVA